MTIVIGGVSFEVGIRELGMMWTAMTTVMANKKKIMTIIIVLLLMSMFLMLVLTMKMITKEWLR